MSRERWDDAYRTAPGVYDAFSRRQDAGDRALSRLLERSPFAGRTVLDAGCGTGAYTAPVAARCERYLGLDASRPMLAHATRRHGALEDASFVRARAEAVPLPDDAVDCVLATWFLSAIPDPGARAAAAAELDRVLRPGGDAWALENDCTGEFMRMRGMAADPDSWTHPLADLGYEVEARVESTIAFPTLEEAKRVLGFLLGEHAVAHLEATGDPTVGHDVLVLRRSAEG